MHDGSNAPDQSLKNNEAQTNPEQELSPEEQAALDKAEAQAAAEEAEQQARDKAEQHHVFYHRHYGEVTYADAIGEGAALVAVAALGVLAGWGIAKYWAGPGNDGSSGGRPEQQRAAATRQAPLQRSEDIIDGMAADAVQRGQAPPHALQQLEDHRQERERRSITTFLTDAGTSQSANSTSSSPLAHTPRQNKAENELDARDRELGATRALVAQINAAMPTLERVGDLQLSLQEKASRLKSRVEDVVATEGRAAAQKFLKELDAPLLGAAFTTGDRAIRNKNADADSKVSLLDEADVPSLSLMLASTMAPYQLEMLRGTNVFELAKRSTLVFKRSCPLAGEGYPVHHNVPWARHDGTQEMVAGRHVHRRHRDLCANGRRIRCQ